MHTFPGGTHHCNNGVFSNHAALWIFDASLYCIRTMLTCQAVCSDSVEVNRSQTWSLLAVDMHYLYAVTCNKLVKSLLASRMLLGFAHGHTVLLTHVTFYRSLRLTPWCFASKLVVIWVKHFTSGDMQPTSALVICQSSFPRRRQILQSSFELATEELDLLACSALHP